MLDLLRPQAELAHRWQTDLHSGVRLSSYRAESAYAFLCCGDVINKHRVGGGGALSLGSGGELTWGSDNELNWGNGGELNLGSGSELNWGSDDELNWGNGGELNLGSGAA